MGCCCFRASGVVERWRYSRSSGEVDGLPHCKIKQFSINELRSATDNFHLTRKIGRGGFGTVYKGSLRKGEQVAVKKLAVGSKQGAREFLTEINTILHVKHPNLVQLIGCCVDGSDRVLVYEYVENSSLHHALLGSKTKIKLSWSDRSTICIGIAKGLAYLHEECVPHIVHRDIKASNILLDKQFNPKIGDFGLAKLFPEDITHISTRIAGTTGYLAPEYAAGGQLTMKADVYGFGVLLLEIISGRSSASSNWNEKPKLLLEWAWRLHEEGKLLELVDPAMGEKPEEEVIRYIKVAFFCTQAKAIRRPMMSQVVDMLSRNIRLNDKELTAPGYFQDLGLSDETSMKTFSGSATHKHSSTSVTDTIVSPPGDGDTYQAREVFLNGD